MFLLEISDSLSAYFPGGEPAFEALANLDDAIVSENKELRVVRFERGGTLYEMAVESGSGAQVTWRGLKKLHDLGLPAPKVVGQGIRTNLLGVGRSFTITEVTEDQITLDTLLVFPDDEPDAVHYRLKRRCLEQLGEIAGRMHRGGMAHRDFSLSSFAIPAGAKAGSPPSDPRVQIRPPRRAKVKASVSRRDQIKDLGRLLTSSFNENLGVTEALRFIRAYLGDSWKDQYRKDRSLWYRVVSRAMMERAMKQRRERRRERHSLRK